MPRKKIANIKRDVKPDPVYGNWMLQKLINRVMMDGKKTVAERQVYGAMDIIKKKHDNPVDVFQKALKQVTPTMEVRSRRIGGAAYQVPTPVRGSRRNSLAIRWILFEARKRSNKEYHTFSEKLAAELLEAAEGEGGAVKRRETAHKMADANKAFSHFRW